MRLVLPVCLFALGCQPTSPPVRPPDSAYWPLQTGQFRIYAVTDTAYRAGSPPVARQYLWREMTGKPFVTLAGDTAYSLTYAHRSDTSRPWQTDSVGTAQLTPTDARRTRGGQTVVVLGFPAFNNQRWDGNRFNALGFDEFRLERCHQPFRSDGKTFDRTLTVVQQNDSTAVSQDRRIEVYGYGIGLVYAERYNLYFCLPPAVCSTPVLYGQKQFVRLIDYGKE